MPIPERLPPELLALLESLADTAWANVRGNMGDMTQRRAESLYATLMGAPDTLRTASSGVLEAVAGLAVTALVETAMRQQHLLADEAALPDLNSPPYERPPAMPAIMGPPPGVLPARTPPPVNIDDLPEPIVVFKTLDYSKDQHPIRTSPVQ